MSRNKKVAETIFQQYLSHYNNEVQGCCPVIALDIIQALDGGEAVAGEITWYGGCCRRTHWWVEKDGETLDPMGDWFLASELGTGRDEHHRDQSLFEMIVVQYEQWRIPVWIEPESNHKI